MTPSSGTFIIADPEVCAAEGVKAILESECGMRCVGVAQTRDAIRRLIVNAACDVAITGLDFGMSGEGEWIADLVSAGEGIPIVIHTRHTSSDDLRNTMVAGASAYVLKQSHPRHLIEAVRVAMDGGTYIDPHVTASLIRQTAKSVERDDRLTQRETEILKMIAFGHGLKEIAADLGVSVKTVETIKRRGSEKLLISNRVGIVRHAVENGWFDHFPSGPSGAKPRRSEPAPSERGVGRLQQGMAPQGAPSPKTPIHAPHHLPDGDGSPFLDGEMSRLP